MAIQNSIGSYADFDDTVHVRPLALTRKEAARALGISLPTLSRWVSRGLLRPSRACRRPVFSIAELERFLRVTATGNQGRRS